MWPICQLALVDTFYDFVIVKIQNIGGSKMIQVLNFFKRINPFSEVNNNSKIEFVIQKIAAYLLLFLGWGILFEGITIPLFSINGYDVLHGQFPAGEWVNLLKFYGMVGFTIITLLYVKLVEKRTLSDIGIQWNLKLVKAIIKGLCLGAGLVAVMITILMILGQYSFNGFGNSSLRSLLVWFGAYFIQASTEEIMCRGFLQTSLARRVKKQTAVLISSIAFALPHMPTLLDLNPTVCLVSVINLLLISVLFSVAVISEKSLGIACGIHIGWNFCLGSIVGLEVTGGNVTNSIFKFILQSNKNILNGGSYGIEASAVLIPILTICIALYVRNVKRSKCE